jgi:phage replication O-like protein O
MTGDDVQIDNGEFTRLHNAILEKMALARLSGAEFRALMFLFRKTYGWNKKEDRISLAQWAEGTNGKRPHVLRTLNELIRKRVIYRTDDKHLIPIYGFNKYFEDWLEVFDVDSERGQRFEKHSEVLPIQETLLPIQVTVTNIGNAAVTNIGNPTVTNTGTHKRQLKTVKDSSSSLKKCTEKTPEQLALVERQKEIIQAYRGVLGYAVPSEGKEGISAKVLAQHGYTADEVIRCYRDMRQESYWNGKHLSLASVNNQIGAWLQRNGNGSADSTEEFDFRPVTLDAMEALR